MPQTLLKRVTKGLRVPIYWTCLLCQIFHSANCILALDPVILELKMFDWYAMLSFARCNFHCWHRPILGQSCMSSEALRDHRNTHHFIRSCCLCPLIIPPSEKPCYRKAVIYMPIIGQYKRKYITECTKSWCRYIG